MTVVAAVFTRGGSKGLPRKNLRRLGDRTLLEHAVSSALDAALVDRVIVSTDDDEIAQVARSAGADVPFRRPADLADDASPEWLAWQHAVRTLEEAGDSCDVLVSVPTTAPLRRSADIDAAVDRLLGSHFDLVLTVTPARRSPWFNMVTVDDVLGARLIMTPSNEVARRQDVPAAFDITTVAYAVRRARLLESRGLFDGSVGAVVVPEERAVDIDTELDLRLAEILWQERRS